LLCLKLNRGDEEDAEEKKSFTAKDAQVAKRTLIGIQFQERRGIAKRGIQEGL